MTSRQRVFAAVIGLLVVMDLVGCAGISEHPEWPRGLEIAWPEVPKPVAEGLRREYPDEAVARIESCHQGQLFRIELSSGSIVYIDKTGAWCGTII